MINIGKLKPPIDKYGQPSPRMGDELSPKVKSVDFSPRSSNTSPSNKYLPGLSLNLKPAINTKETALAVQPLSELIQIQLINMQKSEQGSILKKQPSINEEDLGRKSMVNIDYGMNGVVEQPVIPEEPKKDFISSIFSGISGLFGSNSNKEEESKPKKDESKDASSQLLFTPQPARTESPEDRLPKTENNFSRSSFQNNPFKITVNQLPVESRFP